MVKLAVLIDALNRESGALDEDGRVARAGAAASTTSGCCAGAPTCS